MVAGVWKTLFLCVVALLPLAFAHGPEPEVWGVRLVETDDRWFLEAQLDPPNSEASFALLSVATPSGPTQFEQRRDGGYRGVEHIPVAHELGQLGTSTPYRIRLPEVSRRERRVPLTFLFSGGVLLHREGVVERGARSRWFLPATALSSGGLLVLMVLTWLGYYRRKLQALRRPQGR